MKVSVDTLNLCQIGVQITGGISTEEHLGSTALKLPSNRLYRTDARCSSLSPLTERNIPLRQGGSGMLKSSRVALTNLKFRQTGIALYQQSHWLFVETQADRSMLNRGKSESTIL